MPLIKLRVSGRLGTKGRPFIYGYTKVSNITDAYLVSKQTPGKKKIARLYK